MCVDALNQAFQLQSRQKGYSQFLVNKLAIYEWILKLKVSMEASWQNSSVYHVRIFKTKNSTKKISPKVIKITFTKQLMVYIFEL